MSRIDDFVEAVTYRLRPDPELHMDVSREMRAHLEDRIAEARERGLSHEEAVEEALSHFGEESEVAEGIYWANRRRMRLRAVLKWAARLTLIPAAIAFTLYLCVGDLPRLGYLFHYLPGGTSTERMERLVKPNDHLSERERFVFEHLTDRVSDVKKLVDRFPDRRDFYAYYVRVYLTRRVFNVWNNEPQYAGVIDMLNRGEELDPDNAFYDYAKATVFLKRAAEIEKEHGLCYVYEDSPFEWLKRECAPEIRIVDRDQFEQGIEELKEGAGKSQYKNYWRDIAELRYELAQPADTLSGYVSNVSWYRINPLSQVWEMHKTASILAGYTAQLAREGRKEEATRLIRLTCRAGAQLAEAVNTPWAVQEAALVVDNILGPAPAIYRELGLEKTERQTRERYVRLQRIRSQTIPAPAEEQRKKMEERTGIYWKHVAPPIFDFPHTNAPATVTRAEHINAQKMVPIALVFVVMALTLVLGGTNLWNLWTFRKRADKPKLFFIGWQRVAWIVFLALFVPLVIYWAYSRLAPFTTMNYGIDDVAGRVFVELSLVFSAVLVLLVCLSYHAVRERCRDAGMQVPEHPTLNPLRSYVAAGCMALLLLLTVLFFAADLPQDFGHFLAVFIVLFALIYLLIQLTRTSRAAAFMLALLGVGILSCFMLWAAGKYPQAVWAIDTASIVTVISPALLYVLVITVSARGQQPGSAHFRVTLVRSILPVLTAALLIAGIGSYAYLRVNETQQIEQLQKPGNRVFVDLVEMSRARQLRDHLRELDREYSQSTTPSNPADANAESESAPSD